MCVRHHFTDKNLKFRGLKSFKSQANELEILPLSLLLFVSKKLAINH